MNTKSKREKLKGLLAGKLSVKELREPIKYDRLTDEELIGYMKILEKYCKDKDGNIVDPPDDMQFTNEEQDYISHLHKVSRERPDNHGLLTSPNTTSLTLRAIAKNTNNENSYR